MKLLIKKSENATGLPLPKFQTEGASGMDLYANVFDEETIKAGECKIISSGISVEIPQGYEIQIRGRSSLAFKHNVGVVQEGTLDCDYRGEIKVLLINHSKENFTIKRGDRIAQMIISKYEKPEIIEVKELSETIRGEGGFGSTGK